MRLMPAILLASLTSCSAFGQAYTISTFAGGGVPQNIPGLGANLGFVGVGAVDTAGNIFISSSEYYVVWRLDAKTGLLKLVAGNGTYGLTGDNGPATSAQLIFPSSTAVDTNGNLYIADVDAYVIRKVSANGTIAVVAGNGNPENENQGSNGDGGPAVSTQLYSGDSLAVDSVGNLYIADGNRIRKVSNGVITTVAGNGTAGFSGDGGPALSSQLNGPHSLAVDSAGNLYIFDAGNNRVRLISNGVITTVAGNGTAGFSGDGGPALSAQINTQNRILSSGLAVDASGSLYIADAANNRIRKVSNGMITTVAGNGTFGFSGDGGPATSAGLPLPGGVVVDSAGNLYISDYSQHVRKVSNGLISTVAGGGSEVGDNGPATSANTLVPVGVTVDALGNLYIADTGNNRVRRVSNGVITTVAGNGTQGFSGDGGPATSAQLYAPTRLAVDASGNLYIADTGNNRVRMVSNGAITTVAGNGTPGFSGDGGPAVGAQLSGGLLDVAVDASGNLYIGDSGNNRVRRVSNGVITTVAGNGTSGFSGDGGPATSAQLNVLPGAGLSVALDALGNLYIADFARIREVVNGVITTVAGNGSSFDTGDNGPAISAGMWQPTGIAVDAEGNLYVAEGACGTTNGTAGTVVLLGCRVRKISNGVISTIAGNGMHGFIGDNGPAAGAELDPEEVAVDKGGNVYVADWVNNRIRVLTPSGPSCSASVNPASFTPAAAGGNLSVTIQTSGSCAWAVQSLPPWITYSGNAVAAGPTTITLVVGANTGTARSAIVSVAGISISVSQQGTKPSLSLTAVTNAASNLSGPIAPGEIVVLYGSGLGPAQLISASVGSDGLYDAGLAGTSVQFNGIPAPMIYTSATQVAAIVPYEVTGDASALVTVTYQGQTAAAVTIALSASAPGLFTLGSTGQGQAAAINQNGTINSSSLPAPIGSIISLYATGEGQTSPAGLDGKLATTPLPAPNLPVSVTIGGVTVNNLQYVGGAPGEVAGLLQINVAVPAGVTPGNAVPVIIRVGGATSQANVTLAVASGSGTQALAVTGLSSTSAPALTPLYISTTGLNPNLPVIVQFSNAAGFSVTEQPLRIASDGTVVTAVPLYIDLVSHATASASVSLVLAQGSQLTTPVTLRIQDLPSVSSYGLTPGDISHGFLVFATMAIGRHLNEYQALQSLPGNKVDTSATQAALTKLLTAVIGLRANVDQVSLNSSLAISSGMLPNGMQVQFDGQSLDMMDRMLGLYLTELAPIITSAAAPSAPANPASTHTQNSRLPSKLKAASKGSQASQSTSGLGEALLNTIENANNLTSIALGYQSYFKSDATWSDKVLAVGGGLATLLGTSELPPVQEAGLALGAVVGMASMASDITAELGDVAGMYLASYPGAPPLLQQTAYNDLQSTNGKLLLDTLQTEFSLAAAGSGAGFLGSFGGALYGTLEQGAPAVAFQGASLITNIVQLKFGDDLQTALNAATQQLLNPFTSISQGIANITGTVDVPNYFAPGFLTPGLENLLNRLNEVSVSNNGTAFSTVADPIGNFSLFLSLQDPFFNYAAANFQVLDPVTQDILGRDVQAINLSMLTTATPLQLPTINIFMDYFECFNVYEVIDYGQCVNVHPYPDVSGLLACVSAVNTAFNACAAAAQSVTSTSAYRAANRAVSPAAPGLFALDSFGKGQRAAVDQNGLTVNTAASPAKVGDVISLYATGESQTTPMGADGRPTSVPLAHPNRPVTVTIGGQNAPVQYAGGPPREIAGLMQINVLIPSGIQTGSHFPSSVQVGNPSSQPGVTIAVRGN
jgi:trimeric autotransporter adhesin